MDRVIKKISRTAIAGNIMIDQDEQIIIQDSPTLVNFNK